MAGQIFDDEYFAIIKAEIEDFVDKVYNSIREFGYNLKTTPIVFVGGGAVCDEEFLVVMMLRTFPITLM